jgi:hypothetical protein
MVLASSEHANRSVLANRDGDDPSTAAYTEADVRQHLATHPAFPTTDGSQPVIARVLFIPASEASALMRGTSIGRPDTTLVCYVEVHGNLSTSWVHVPKPGVFPAMAHVGVLVFDAQTGNILIGGLTVYPPGESIS